MQNWTEYVDGDQDISAISKVAWRLRTASLQFAEKYEDIIIDTVDWDTPASFSPTSSSWLNMVERFFRDLTQNHTRRGKQFILRGR